MREGNQFRSWIYVIAGNTCRDSVRRNATRKTISINEEIHDAAESNRHMQPGGLLAAKDMMKILKQAMNRLPEEQRVVLIMKEYEGFKFKEIAQVLGESENTIKSRIYYALKSMRKMLKQYEQEEL